MRGHHTQNCSLTSSSGTLSTGSSIWHPACRQAARTEDKSKVGEICGFLVCFPHAG